MFGFGSSDGTRTSSLLERGKAILSVLLRMLHNRVELVANEVQEEYERLWPLVIQTLISFILLGFGLLFLSVFIIVLFWDTHRLMALGLMAAFYLMVGIAMAAHVHRTWTHRRKLFSTTLEELEKDITALQGD